MAVVAMNRRFLYMVLGDWNNPFYTLHRVNPSRLFYPNGAPEGAPAAVEKARLSRPAMTFRAPEPTHFWILGRGKDKIVGVERRMRPGPDDDVVGRALLYEDGGAPSVGVFPRMRAAKYEPISVPVGDNLYVMETAPVEENDDDCCFRGEEDDVVYNSVEALVHSPKSEDWSWRSLPPPPRDGRISAYAAVGESHIWVSLSMESRGTYCLDTASGGWSKAGDWNLPFDGRAEYSPELGLWFSFSPEGSGGLLRACDLRAASASAAPAARHTWDGFAVPDGHFETASHVLHLGGGRFCVAKLFEAIQRPRHRCMSCHCERPARRFAVFTGVEVRGCGGELRMVRHKACQYKICAEKMPECVL